MKRAIFAIVFVLAVFFVVVMLKKPSHDRDWEEGQEELPKILVEQNSIEILNFRDFVWKKDGTWQKRYVAERFSLDQLQSTDVIISHFSDFEGLAHIFLSFGFSDGRHAVVSMETRREKDEEFSPILGLLREFEIIYVVGSERDIVGLRTDVRDERVYLYPTIADPEKSKELFLKIAQDINLIHEKPKFYNTLADNCTNVITRRVEEISELNFRLTHKTLMPGYFDEVLHEMGLIADPAGKNFQETKACHLIDNEKVDYESEQFGVQIRRNCKTGQEGVTLN
jgi:hypothetical protein